MIKKNTKSLSNWIFCVIVRVWFVQFYLNKASIFNSLRTLSFAFFASLTKKVAIDFTLAFHWLRGWRTFSRPIIEPDEAKPIKSGSTFHTRLKNRYFFLFYPFRELLKSRLPGEIHGKRSAVFQKRCAISSLDIFQHHTKMFLRLKTAPHSNHKRILGEGQNVSFCEHLLHLISVQHKLLVHLLHRKSHLSLFVSY